jgi:hypothetical protein
VTKSKSFSASLGLSTFILVLLWFPAVSQQAGVSTNDASDIASDTIFRKASNSPGYLVVKKADWDRLRKIWSDSLRMNKDLLQAEKIKYLSKLDSIQQIPPAANLPEIEKEQATVDSTSPDSTTLLLGLGLVFFVLYGAVITFQFISQRSGRKSHVERLELIEEDFNRHKKNSIERERKLLRELIDTQNELALEKAKQNPDSD